jgi:hypothetical protein
MIIIPSQAIHMNRKSGCLRKALQAMWNHLTAQISNLLPLQPQINDTEWTIRDIDYGAGKSFVERCVGISKACDADRYSKGCCEGAAEGNANVFCSVMVVDYSKLH